MHAQAHAAPSSWGLGCVSQEPRGCDDAEVWPAAWEDAGGAAPASAPSPAPGAGAPTPEFEEPGRPRQLLFGALRGRDHAPCDAPIAPPRKTT